jgi:DNA-binding transcriptional LysR family regulator
VELRAVRAFLAVAETGSVTAAARLVHVSQPALSRQIQAFERELGLTLFDRRESRLVLTSAGRQFMTVARDLVLRADLAVKAADAIRAGALPTITISAPGTTLTDVVAPFLATWDSEDPMPRVWEEVPAAIYSSLARGADLAIGTEPPPAGLGAHPIAVLPVWAYVAPSHRWAGTDVVALADLVTEPLLVLDRGQHARRALDAALVETGLAPESLTEFATPEVAQAVAAAGRGVAVVSDDARFGLAPVGISVEGHKLVVRLFAAWAPDHHAAATIASIAVRLSRFCLQRYGTEAA